MTRLTRYPVLTIKRVMKTMFDFEKKNLQYGSRVTSPLLASASVEYLRVLASPCFVNIHNLLNDSRFSSDLYSRVKRVNKFDLRALKFCRMHLRLELKSSDMTLLGKSKYIPELFPIVRRDNLPSL